jgi:hypothetical protein
MAQHFATAQSVDEKLDADVLDTSQDTVYVEYPSGETKIEARNTRNELLFLSDTIPNDGMVTFWGYVNTNPESVLTDSVNEETAITIQFEYDVHADEMEFTIDGDAVDTSLIRMDTLLEPVMEFRKEYVPPHSSQTPEPDVCMQARLDTAQTLFERYHETTSDMAVPMVVDEFVDAFDADITVQDDGWLIDDRVHVDYASDPYLTGEHTIYDCTSATDPEEFSTEPRCINMMFNTDIRSKPTSYNGVEASVKNSIEFLATVAVLTEPVTFLDVDYFDDGYKEQLRQDSTVVENLDVVADVANTVTVNSFVDPVSGIAHSHGFNKHKLTDKVSVSRDVIDELHFSDFDHAGPHEMMARRDELEREFDTIFTETVSDPWKKISNARERALVPNRVYDEL